MFRGETVKAKIVKRILETYIEAQKPTMLWDSELIGFGVRISPKGKASFFANKWQGGTAGRHKRVTLGHFPHLTVQGARNLAIKELADASNGIDIAARKKEKKHKAQLDGITLQ